MYYNHNHRMIESDDIEDIQHVHIAEEHGQKVAYIQAVLDPRKHYQDEAEVHVHLTNGVNHRTFGPFRHVDPLVPIKEEESEEEQKEGMSQTPEGEG